MAIQQGLTTSFKQQMLQAGQNLLTDTLYISLYTAFSTIGPNTTVYTTDSEITGTGYTAGGIQLTGATIGTDSEGTVYVDFANVTWPNSQLTARGALIYNVTRSNASVAVLDFGSDKTMTNFTITMPVNTSTTALIRFP
jgi:hypothetical protein